MDKQQLNLFTEQSIVNINADCLGNIANKNLILINYENQK